MKFEGQFANRLLCKAVSGSRESCGPKWLLSSINAVVRTLIWTALIVIPQSVSAQVDTWETKAPMPTAVYAPAAGAIGGKLYVVGGTISGCTDSAALEVYDPGSNTWASKSPLPEPRHAGGAGVIDGKLYVVGGSSSPCADPGNARLYVYDPVADTWTRKADMPTPRVNLAAAVMDGKLYALGGQNGGGTLNTFEMYDPVADAWTARAPFPTGISGVAVGVVDGKLYAAGGLEFCCTSLAMLWAYDPAANAWTSKAPLPSGRNQAAGGVTNGIFYVAGGIGGSDNTNTLFAYDSAADSWTTRVPMSIARGGHAAATINGQLFVVGGNGAGGVGPLSSLEVFTAALPAWTQLLPTGGPPDARVAHTAVYDPGTNRMIVSGGSKGSDILADVWVLSNANGKEATTPTWTQLPAGGPRNRHSSVYDVASNRMIVYGGFSGSDWLNEVWVLSNANGVEATTPTWTQLFPTGGSPILYRFAHSAVYDPAANRMIVFAGRVRGVGDTNDVWVLSNANGLEPTTPAWTQLSTTGGPPSARESHSAVYDPLTNRMTVFAGSTGGVLANDVWVLSNANGLEATTATWTQLAAVGELPSGRAAHSAVYDSTTNRMTVVDGLCCNSSSFLLDVWVLSNANGVGGTPAWTQLFPTGGPTFGIYGHSAIYDPATKRMTMFGGYNGGYDLNDVWVLAGADGSSNQAPTAHAGPDQTSIVGESVQFNGAASFDPDGTITNFHWEFGGNGTADGAIVNHVFNSAGQFTVTLTITDNAGATASDTAVATVLTNSQAIQSLTQIVQSFNLQQGITNSLDSKLQNIQDALSASNSGSRQDAINKLQAFISSAEAQRGKQLTAAQADTLEAMARRILAVL